MDEADSDLDVTDLERELQNFTASFEARCKVARQQPDWSSETHSSFEKNGSRSKISTSPRKTKHSSPRLGSNIDNTLIKKKTPWSSDGGSDSVPVTDVQSKRPQKSERDVRFARVSPSSSTNKSPKRSSPSKRVTTPGNRGGKSLPRPKTRDRSGHSAASTLPRPLRKEHPQLDSDVNASFAVADLSAEESDDSVGTGITGFTGMSRFLSDEESPEEDDAVSLGLPAAVQSTNGSRSLLTRSPLQRGSSPRGTKMQNRPLSKRAESQKLKSADGDSARATRMPPTLSSKEAVRAAALSITLSDTSSEEEPSAVLQTGAHTPATASIDAEPVGQLTSEIVAFTLHPSEETFDSLSRNLTPRTKDPEENVQRLENPVTTAADDSTPQSQTANDSRVALEASSMSNASSPLQSTQSPPLEADHTKPLPHPRLSPSVSRAADPTVVRDEIATSASDATGVEHNGGRTLAPPPINHKSPSRIASSAGRGLRGHGKNGIADKEGKGTSPNTSTSPHVSAETLKRRNLFALHAGRSTSSTLSVSQTSLRSPTQTSMKSLSNLRALEAKLGERKKAIKRLKKAVRRAPTRMPSVVGVTRNSNLLYYLLANRKIQSDELLGELVHCPSRHVLVRAEALGPETSWKDGYLHSKSGFLPPQPGQSFAALRKCRGQVWALMAQRLPALQNQSLVREALRRMPLVEADESTIPDEAVSAAVAALSILVQSYKFEHDAAALGNSEVALLKASIELPEGLAKPWFTLCKRLGRFEPHLTFVDANIENAVVVDHNDPEPWTLSNMRLAFPAFGRHSEGVFLLVQTHMLGRFAPCVEAIVRCQEWMLLRDVPAVIRELVEIKAAVDEMVSIFHQISVNPLSHGYVDPVMWGKTFARWSGPWKSGVPAVSGLMSPMFHVLDTFLGRDSHKSFLGQEVLQVRKCMPKNWRDFIEAVGEYPISQFITDVGIEGMETRRLHGLYRGLLDAYAGERGFLGAHRYKVYSFLEIVMKTGRTANKRGALSGNNSWETLHEILAEARLERYANSVTRATAKSNGGASRGTYRECAFLARIKSCEAIDSDPVCETRQVILDLTGTGLTYRPGDRIVIVPSNRSSVVSATLEALYIDGSRSIPLTPLWRDFFSHMLQIKFLRTDIEAPAAVPAKVLLQHARLAPLQREEIAELHSRIAEIAGPDTADVGPTGTALVMDVWPSMWSLKSIADTLAMDGIDIERLFRPASLSEIVRPESTRTYSISSAPTTGDILPKELSLTVTRTSVSTATTGQSPSMSTPDARLESRRMSGDPTKDSQARPRDEVVMYGTASSFLNPPLPAVEEETSVFLSEASLQTPTLSRRPSRRTSTIGVPMGFQLPHAGADAEKISDFLSHTDDLALVGTSSPINFTLPKDSWVPIVMFAAGSGIGPFRAFLQQRLASGQRGGANWLFLGTKTRSQIPYQQDLFEAVRLGRLTLRVSFSRDDAKVVVPAPKSLAALMTGGAPEIVDGGRRGHIDKLILEEEAAVWSLMLPTDMGGESACFYICGRVQLYESVFSTLRRVIKLNNVSEDLVLGKMFAEKRIMMEVFMTPRSLDDDPVYEVSDVVKHNSTEFGFWIVIDEKVYDVTTFLYLHPGGTRILRELCGRDASKSFRQVNHHINAEVQSLLRVYYIGRMRIPDMREDRVQIYKSWVSVTYALVEIENTLSNEFEGHTLAEPEVTSETDHAGSTSSISMIKQYLATHERFLTSIVQGIFGAEFKMLFSLAAAPLVVEGHSVTSKVLDDIESCWSSQPVKAALSTVDTMKDLLLRRQHMSVMFGDKEFTQMMTFCEHVSKADLAFLREVKMVARDGLVVFETGGPASDLMDVFPKFVSGLRDLYKQLQDFVGFKSSRWSIVDRHRREFTAGLEDETTVKARPLTVHDLLGNAVSFATDMQSAKKAAVYTSHGLTFGAFAKFADPTSTASDFEQQMTNAAAIMKALPTDSRVTKEALMAKRWIMRTDLRTLFEKIDKDNSGGIDKAEVQDLLMRHRLGRSGIAPEDTEVIDALHYLEKNFDDLDKDNSGSIEFDEFFEMWNERRTKEDRATLLLQKWTRNRAAGRRKSISRGNTGSRVPATDRAARPPRPNALGTSLSSSADSTRPATGGDGADSSGGASYWQTAVASTSVDTFVGPSATAKEKLQQWAFNKKAQEKDLSTRGGVVDAGPSVGWAGDGNALSNAGGGAESSWRARGHDYDDVGGSRGASLDAGSAGSGTGSSGFAMGRGPDTLKGATVRPSHDRGTAHMA